MSGYIKIPIVSGGGGGDVDSVNGKTGVVVINKTDVGLSNVDNTSDLNKPVSTATQTELNLKENTGVASSLLSLKGKLIYIDKTRSDSYVESGSFGFPYKTIQSAIDYASSVGDGGSTPYSFIIASGTYAEEINLNDKGLFSISIKALGRVAINPSSGNALTSNSNNGDLQDLVVEGLEFGKPVVLLGDGTANQFKTTEFRDCSFAGTGTLSLNRLNNFALKDVYAETAFTITNVNFMFFNGGQIQGTFTYVMDSTLPQPANGVVGGINLLSMMMNEVSLTVGGSAVMNFVPHNCRIGTTAGNFTIPSGCNLIAYNSVLRGNWTNSGVLHLRNSHSENNISGTTPIITSNRSNQTGYTPTTSGNWSSVPTEVSGALDTIAGDLVSKENLSNKATDFTTINDTLYPSVEAVEERVQAIPNFVGENGTINGVKGLVPAPAVLDGKTKSKFLMADGSWSGQTEYHTSRKEAIANISTWTQGSSTGNQWFGMCYAPDKELYVAVCATGGSRVQISRNGKIWRNITAAGVYTWVKVCYAEEIGRFVAVAYEGAIMYSDDGENWTLVLSPAAAFFYDVCYSPELKLFLAVGLGGGTGAASSPDGVTWTAVDMLGYVTNNYSCCWSPELSLFAVIRLGGPVLTSPDGVTWTENSIVNRSWSQVVWAKELGKFIAVGVTGSGRSATSPDGVTWTTGNLGNAAWRSVSWSPDLGMAIAVSTGGNLAYSFDGETWTNASNPQGSIQWQNVIWSRKQKQFLICGVSRLMWSRNIRNYLSDSSELTRKRYAYNTTSTAFNIGENQRQSLVIKQGGGACTATIPLAATYNPPIGSQYRFAQGAADAITFASAVGVTLISRGGLVTTNGQGSVVTLEKIGIDTWLLSGDLV